MKREVNAAQRGGEKIEKGRRRVGGHKRKTSN